MVLAIFRSNNQLVLFAHVGPREQIAELFAMDFERFGYDPNIGTREAAG